MLLRTEPAALFGILAAFLVGGLRALGADGTIPADVADSLSVLVPVVFSLVIRAIVTSPATAARLVAGDGVG
jgi:hypothetical protein